MRTVMMGLISLLAGLMVTGQTTKPVVSGAAWLGYTDTVSGMSVQYPATWRLKTTNPKSPIVLHAPSDGPDDRFSENINFISRELPHGQKVTLEDIAMAVRNNLTTVVDNFELQHEKNGQWLGVKSVEIAYTGTSKGENSGVQVRILQRIALLKGKMILATYSAEGGKADAWQSAALQIIDKTMCKK